ncbi:MAG: phosphomethylpyrimidine synthase ThiC, partial [Elusimicrobia bacterium]|nr:phosphomethylpyrimidine synthase ThiC [Elusimicrobiota bacterium]MBD3411813.1 phosphomethylpyrimidine synthase ThiC [Elusimicrobiota bacterium]
MHSTPIPEWLHTVARNERMSVAGLKQGLVQGSIVMPRSSKSPVPDDRLCAIGTGVRTKVNANIGSSPDRALQEFELHKLEAAISAGADTVMDLSTGGDLRMIRRAIRSACPVPLGTVPIYQAVCETVRAGRNITDLDAEHLFNVIEQHADEGVDFITVHCGINRVSVDQLMRSGRIAGVVSRGGAFIVSMMQARNIENPLFEQFDRLLSIAREYDMTLSLGDGLRPGGIHDASDNAQFSELLVLGDLVRRCRDAQVSVIVEGPGHVPLNQIKANVEMEKTVCLGAPFYVLGPLVTDIAAGYDHITSAIGGAVAAAAGADFLCYVTPSEHIHLPDSDDVHRGVMASRIAAHAGDIAKGVPGAREWDDAMSHARKSLDWEKQCSLAIDPRMFRHLREEHRPKDREVCTMCGEF